MIPTPLEETDIDGMSTVLVDPFSIKANTSGRSMIVGGVGLLAEADFRVPRFFVSDRGVEDRLELCDLGREIES